MQDRIEKAIRLKQILVNFIYDAEDEIAVALETYALEKSKKNSYGIKQQNLTVDLFITDGQVKEQTPLEIFLATSPDLTPEEKHLIQQWQNNFIGLFEIKAIENDYYQLMNWLTGKEYQVYGHSQLLTQETKRWQPREIILAIIAPLAGSKWFFFSDRIIKGKLSQPKLAIAIGEFRDHYPDFLYADAPDLLAEAWSSVEVYHQEFIDFFSSAQITLPGYKLNQKIAELQQIISAKKLELAGIDSNQSLSEIIAASDSNEAEFTETAANLGIETQTIEQIIKNKSKLSMVTPKVDLPPDIKQAESVTVYSHPQWGQMFLPNFNKFMAILKASELTESDRAIGLKLIEKYIQQPEANYYVWQQLKQTYPSNLKILLQAYTNNPNFNLDDDLANLIGQNHKHIAPKLPAIASVPLHLNNLFESAVAQVQKHKSKHKTKKRKKGFA